MAFIVSSGTRSAVVIDGSDYAENDMLGQLQHNEFGNPSIRSFLPQFIEKSNLRRILLHSEEMKSCALGKSVFQVMQYGNCSQQMLRLRLG